MPDGTLWCEVYRQGDAYRMRFPALADFVVRRDGHVACHPVPGTDDPTLQHLHFNQVVPAALSLQHRPVFHASALAFDSTAVAAFLGESGRGKSTLATFLGSQGHPLITDDGLELREADGVMLAMPSQPSIRLWSDSRNALLPEDAIPQPPVSFTPKARFLSDGLLPFASHPVPLRCAYFLGDGSADAIDITPLTPQQAHMAWVKHSFLLDVRDREMMQVHFRQVAHLSRLGISYTLDYPRRYDLLPEVAAALRAHMAE